MDRRDAARHAAEAAYSIAYTAIQEAMRGDEEPYEGAREFRAKLAIENAIADAFGRNFDSYLDRAIGDAIADEQYMRMGVVDLEPGHKTKCEELLVALEHARLQVSDLKSHRCRFGSDDYCYSCGLDGRA